MKSAASSGAMLKLNLVSFDLRFDIPQRDEEVCVLEGGVVDLVKLDAIERRTVTGPLCESTRADHYPKVAADVFKFGFERFDPLDANGFGVVLGFDRDLHSKRAEFPFDEDINLSFGKRLPAGYPCVPRDSCSTDARTDLLNDPL